MPRLPLLKHFATWWKSCVTIHDGVLCPAGPFVRYDPFEFYVPYGEGNRDRVSLPFVFLAVDPSDEKAVAAFCSRYGMLGAQIQTKVDMGWPRSSGLNRDLGRLLNSSVAERDRELRKLESVVAIHALAREATPIEVFVQSQQILREVARRAKPESGKNPSDRRLLEHVFDRKTARAWPRLAWDQDAEQWCLGWNIDSLETALYLMLLFDVQSGASIRR
jgi:hypothetical protein